MMNVKRIALFAVSLLLLSSCADDGSQDGSQEGTDSQELRSVTWNQPVIDSLSRSPWYVAEELGFFEEEGYDVTLQGHDSSGAAMQAYLAGRGDIISAGTDQFLIALDRGQDQHFVFHEYPVPIFGLVVLQDSPIQSVGDLDGRTIGVTGLEGGEIPTVTVLLNDAGLDLGEDVKLVPVGDQAPGIVEAFESERIDAFGGAITEFAALGATGLEFRQIQSEQSATFPGGGTTSVSRETLEEDPEMVVGLTRALAKAIHAYITVPEVAEAATKAQIPASWEDPETATFILDAFIPAFTPEDQDQYGATNIDGWVPFVEHLTEVPGEEGSPILEGDFDILDHVSNDFIAEINDFDRASVESAAREYVANTDE